MTTPTRVQLSRRKGWRIPPDTIVVARPGRWGNPFAVERYGRARAVALFRRMIDGHGDMKLDPDEERAFEAARQAWLQRLGGDATQRIRDELRGRNLACWCPLDGPCHADVLIEVANENASDAMPSQL